MNPLAQHFTNILRISPNENGGDDASPLLKGEGVTLSDSKGNYLPISFVKVNDEGTHIIIQTKTTEETSIIIKNDLRLKNSISLKELTSGNLIYPSTRPNEKNENTWILGSTSQNLSSLIWFNLDTKFEMIKDDLIKNGISLNSIPENVILYHAMPYKRFMFYKDNDLPTLKDFNLCDGTNNTPNLYREDPTFIRGLNFAYGERIYSFDDTDEKNIQNSSLTVKTNRFNIGYYSSISTNSDIQGNDCNYYPKVINDIGIRNQDNNEISPYPATTNYLTPKMYNHRHLLFTELSGDTNISNNESLCSFTTISEPLEAIKSSPTGYEPLFGGKTNEEWDNYCSGKSENFHGLLPIPTQNYADQIIHPISKSGFIPFQYNHKLTQNDTESLIKYYTGKYELHGIEEEKQDNKSLSYKNEYTDNYIWRSVTSLPVFLNSIKDKPTVNTDVMLKETKQEKPYPTFINLLPLMRKTKNTTEQ